MVVVTRAAMRARIGPSPGYNKDEMKDRCEVIPEEISDDSSEEWKIYYWGKSLKGKKKKKPINESLETAISFVEIDQDERTSFFISKIRETCCRKCGTKGK